MPDPVAPPAPPATSNPPAIGDVKPSAAPPPAAPAAASTTVAGSATLSTEPNAAPNADSKPAAAAAEGEKGKQGENVEYQFKAPKGVTLDPEMVSEFSGIAKGLNLKGEDAQKIVDLGPKLVNKVLEAQAKAFTETREKWVAEVKADQEVGGNNFDKSRELAVRGVNFVEAKVPGFKNLLNESGWGDNPILFKSLRVIGQSLGEDGAPLGSAGGQSAKSLAQKIYPNMNP